MSKSKKKPAKKAAKKKAAPKKKPAKKAAKKAAPKKKAAKKKAAPKKKSARKKQRKGNLLPKSPLPPPVRCPCSQSPLLHRMSLPPALISAAATAATDKSGSIHYIKS
jgi:hypothetical protein